MKYIRRQNIDENNVLDSTFLKRADGDIELNPKHRVIVNGDMQFAPGVSIPSVEISNVMYVTMDGDDKNNGKGEGPNQAKRTIKSAVEAAQEGTTIFVRSGEYYEDNPIRIPPKVAIVGDNLRRTIVRPNNKPIKFEISSIAREDGIVTVTTTVPHSLVLYDRVRVTCSESDVDDETANIIEIPSSMTFRYKDFGSTIVPTPVTGTVEKGFDLFKVNSQNYIAQMVFKGLQAPAYCFDIDRDAIVDTSPYVQNCSNINGPWMRNGEEWIPFVTTQPDLSGTFITGPRPLMDNEIDPTQVGQYGINVRGAGGGMLIDGDRYNSLSPVKSMVGDAFTQVAQGAVGFHITNFGYMQLVSCFAVFCDKAFLTTKGGYLSVSNSVIDFGNDGFIADGFYPIPYATGLVDQDYFSTVASITVVNPGSGYETAPDIIIEPPDTPGGVTAVAEASLDPSRGTINAITVLDAGTGYTREPSVTIVGGSPIAPASGRANLATNFRINIKQIGDKPQVASVMFLGDDPIGYYISETDNSTQSFKYNEQKCRRDVGLILDAVLSDTVFGTNHKSVYAGLSYLRSYSAKVLSLQKSPTIDGVVRAKELALTKTLDPVAQERISDNFDIVINTLQNGLAGSSEVELTSPVAREAGLVEARNILLANKEFIKDEIVYWIAENAKGFEYNEEKCSRDVGLIVEAILADMVLGSTYLSTYAGISYLRSYASTVTRSQKRQTVDGINRARDIILKLIPDAQYNTEQIIRKNFKIITDIINAGNTRNVQPVVYTNTTVISPELASSVAQLKANKSFLAEEVVSFIRDSLDVTSIPRYNENICKRDTEYVIDALIFDLLYGGNSATVSAGLAYFIGNSSTVIGEEAAFNQAFDRLSQAAEAVIKRITWTKSATNFKNQDITNPAGDQISADTVIDLIDVVVDIIENGPSSAPVIVSPDYSNGAFYPFKEADRQLILINLLDIRQEVIDYLNNVYKGNFVYNEATCRRDVDYIVDAIAYDLTYGGNSATTVAALAYGDGSVILGQVEETLNAYKHWRTILFDILQNKEIVPSAGNTTSQIVNLPLGNPSPVARPATTAQNLLQIIIDVVDFGTGYVPDPVSEPLFTLGDSDLADIRTSILEDSELIQADVIEYLNITYGGEIEVIVFPGIVTVNADTVVRFHNPSTISTASTVLEYVGAGVTYNALPFYGGQPDPDKERIEINQGKCFTVSTDQIGNFRIGEIFKVNSLTGGVTIDAENLDLSGLSAIGPFKRNGALVGEQLREVSNNPNLISSLGSQDTNTVPTQQAVSSYVEDRYLNKVQGTTTQTVQSDVSFIGDVNISGGDLTTSEEEFNLLNTTVNIINFGNEAGIISIGDTLGNTTINHDLTVNGNTTLGNDKDQDSTEINGEVIINLPENEFDSLVIIEGNTEYISIDTLLGNEKIIFETVPTVEISNTTDSEDKNSGALVVAGGVGIEKNLVVGVDLTVDRNAIVVGDLEVQGGDLTTDQSVFNLLNTVADTVNFAGTATDVQIGATAGITNINNNLNVVGDVNIDGGDLTATTLQFNLIDNIVETVNFARASTAVTIGATTGTTTIRNANTVVTGDLAVNGGDLTTDQTTFNLLDTTADVVNFAGAATEINVGSNTGNTNVLNNFNVDINSRLGIDTNSINTVNGQLTINLKDNTSDILNVTENSNSYIKINTNNSLEYITFGSLPRYEFLNSTESTTTLTGSAVFAGGVGISKNVNIGGNVDIDGSSILGTDINVDTLLVTGQTSFVIPDNEINAFEIKENNVSYIDVGTVDGSELIKFGSIPKIIIENVTDSTSKDTGSLVVEGGVGIEKSVNIGGSLAVTGNTIFTGDLAVNGGDLTTTATTFNLIDANAATVNFARAGTAVTIGATTGTTTIRNAAVVMNGDATIGGDLAVNGGDLTTNQVAFNLLNATAATVNFAGEAASINIGATTGTATIRNTAVVMNGDLEVQGGDITTDQTTFNLLDATATTVNFARAGTAVTIGATTGTATIRNAAVVMNGDLEVQGGDITTDQTEFNLINTTATTGNLFGASSTITIGATTGTTTIRNATTTITGNANINGGTLATAATTFNLVNTTATTGNLFGAATNITIGAITGTTTIRNADVVMNGDLEVQGGDLTTNQVAFNLLNANATTVNFAGEAASINIGATTGTATIRNANVVMNGDLEVQGGDITTDAATFNLVNTTATTGNLFGAATNVTIGATTGTATIRNAAVVMNGDLAVNGGDLTTTATTFNLIDTTAATVNFARAGTAVTIGATTGTTTIRNANTVVTGDLAVNGGDLTTDQITFNLIDDTAATVNFARAGTAVTIGATTGTATIRNAEVILNGDLQVQGGDITTDQTEFNLINTVAATGNLFGAGTNITIGATTGTTTIRNATTTITGNANVNGGTLATSATTFNLIDATAATVNFARAGTAVTIGATTGTTTIRNADVVMNGDLEVQGGDITTNASTFNLIDATAATVNFARDATAITLGATTGTATIRNANVVMNGDLEVQGGDLTTDQLTFNLVNTTATTGNLFGAGTNITIGAVTGTATIRNANTVVTGDLAVNGGDLTTNAATFNLIDTIAATVNFARAGTAVTIGATTGTATIRNAEVILNGDLQVQGGDLTTNQTEFNLLDTTAATVNFARAGTAVTIGATTGTATIRNAAVVMNGDLEVQGGDLTTDQTEFNLINTTATTVNAFGSATDIQIGSSTGITSVKHNLDVDGDVNIDGGDLTTNQTTFNLLNSTVTTGNLFGDATTINIGAAGVSGILTVRNNNVVLDGDLQVKGGDLTTNQTTFNLIDTTATTINFAGAATNITIGDVSGTTTIRNANVVMSGDLEVRGGALTTNQAEFNLLDTTAVIVNFARAASTLTIGSLTGTTTIRSANAVMNGDLEVQGGDLTTNQTTFNLLDATAATVNFARAGTDITIGATTGTTTIRNANTVVTGDLAVNGGDITTNQITFNLVNTTATTGNLFGAATNITIGATTGTATIRNANAVMNGDLEVQGSDLTTNQTTFNLIDTTATTVNFARAASMLTIGSTGGTATIRNANVVMNGDLAVQGGDLTTNQTTFNLIDTTATTINFAGEGSNITIGATNGTTTIRNANTVVTGDLAVEGGDLTTNAATFNLLNTNATTVNAFGAATELNLAVTASSGIVNIGGVSSVVNIQELTLTEDLEVQYGGTGRSTFTVNGVIYGNAADGLLVTAASVPGSNATTSFGVLTTDINNVPVWTDVIDGGSY